MPAVTLFSRLADGRPLLLLSVTELGLDECQPCLPRSQLWRGDVASVMARDVGSVPLWPGYHPLDLSLLLAKALKPKDRGRSAEGFQVDEGLSSAWPLATIGCLLSRPKCANCQPGHNGLHHHAVVHVSGTAMQSNTVLLLGQALVGHAAGCDSMSERSRPLRVPYMLATCPPSSALGCFPSLFLRFAHLLSLCMFMQWVTDDSIRSEQQYEVEFLAVLYLITAISFCLIPYICFVFCRFTT